MRHRHAWLGAPGSGGPPASRRQYQRAKTRILVAQRATAETNMAVGGSLCAGKAAINNSKASSSPVVRTPVMTTPRRAFRRCWPLRWVKTVGISNARTREGKSQRGPTVRASGRAVYSPPLASGVRGSLVVARPSWLSSYASLPHPRANGSVGHGAPDPAPDSRPFAPGYDHAGVDARAGMVASQVGIPRRILPSDCRSPVSRRDVFPLKQA